MDLLSYGGRFLLRMLPRFFDGLLVTVEVAACALPLAALWGFVLLGPRMSRRRWLDAPARAYVEFMRNTPLLLQIYVIYFGLPLVGIRLSEFLSGVLAITLQHGAFLVEIYRGAILAVGRQQWDGGLALGMQRRMAFRFIVLPQAFITVLPLLANQTIVLIKDTSLVSAIGVADLTLTAKSIIERSAASYEVFVAIAIFYFALTALVGLGFRLAERHYRSRF